MRKLYTRIKFPVLLFLIAVSFAFQSEETSTTLPKITLDEQQGRYWLNYTSANTSFDLCGLTKGTSYHIIIGENTNSLAGQASIMSVSGTEPIAAENGFSFKAVSECMQLQLGFSNGLIQNTGSILLSISKKEDPAKANPQKSMAPAISTVPGIPASTLITDFLIAGDCFEVGSISSAGTANQLGTFTNGGTSIGFDTGIMLSTGNTTIATGPNDITSAGTDEPNVATDSDLAQIIGNAALLNDVAVIEFDFTPTIDVVTFNYVFASEEYCDWVGSAFNDVFGFFISGPGISGPFSNGGQNIAVIPGTAIPIAINSVNHVSNTGYYVGNIPAGSGQFLDPDCAGHPVAGAPGTLDCQFDGWTVSLTATANVIPCSTYHIKLAIADVSDGIYDSAVFLEANSLNLGGEANVSAVGNIGGTNIAYEGCQGAYFEFIREDLTDLSEAVVVVYTISGTATNGTDYTNIPVTITIPAGQISVQLPIDAFDDLIPEGAETIIIEPESPCTCDSQSIEMIIEDPPALSSVIDDISVCEGQGPYILDGSALGGIPPVTYSWSNGANTPFIAVNPVSDDSYTVTITDNCGNSIIESADITILPIPTATLSGTESFCEFGGPDVIDLTVNFTGIGPWEFAYAIDGIQQAPITTSDNPYSFPINTPGIYSLIYVESIDAGCLSSGQSIVFINEISLNPIINGFDPLCTGDSNGGITLIVIGGSPLYTYEWTNGLDPVQNPLNVGAGNYQVTITDANNCTDTTSVVLNDPPLLELGIDSITNVNCENPGGTITLDVNGGVPVYSYEWNTGAMDSTLTDIPAGNYTVSITDFNGCIDTISATVEEDIVAPQAIGFTDDTINCISPTIIIDGSGSSAGSEFIYSWSTPDGNIISGSDSLNPEVDEAGTYTLTVINTQNGCTDEVTVSVMEDTAIPFATGTSIPITCNDPTILIDGTGSSAGSEFSYSWNTSDGNIIEGDNSLNPEVDQSGTYTLLVTNSINGCTMSTDVLVEENLVFPEIDPGPPGELTCIINSIQLQGGASGNTDDFVYQWSTLDGNIVSGAGGLNPIVNLPGEYTLIVIDTINGCSSDSVVTISQDADIPNAFIIQDSILNCSNNTLILDGSGSTEGPTISFDWEATNGGNIISGNDSYTPIVDAPGIYILTVSNAANDCTITTSIEIQQDTIQPNVQIENSDTLTCDLELINLVADVSSNSGNFDWTWETQNGNIVSGADGLEPEIDAPGTYSITVWDSVNGCSVFQTIDVDQDINYPTVLIETPIDLTCIVSELTLDSDYDSQGVPVDIMWETSGAGSILNGSTTTQPVVNAPGIYEVSVTNLENGCETISSILVNQDTITPIVEAGATNILTCDLLSWNLDGSASSTGVEFQYSWSTFDGNIMLGNNTASPLINEPGTYTLEILNTANGCIDMDEVTITQDTISPDIIIDPADILSCNITSLVLNGNSGPTNDYAYSWTTANGNIVSGGATETPLIDAPGIYIYEIENTNNGCESFDSVLVVENVVYPVAVMNDPALLTCTITEIPLSGIGTSAGPEFSYLWTTSDGNLLNGEQSLEPVINEPGVYYLEVFNSDNGCSTLDSLEVAQDIEEPDAIIGPNQVLTCELTEINLDGTGSSQGLTFTYEWTTINGNIISGGDSDSPLVNATGQYLLTVTNTFNGCSSNTFTNVDLDTIAPIIEIQEPEILTCELEEVNLDAGLSSSGEYTWSTLDGNIISGSTGPNPLIDQPGTYTLVLLDPDNGCLSELEVEVSENVIYPVVDAGSDGEITCIITSLNLDGSIVANSNILDINWTTTNGNIQSGANTIEPLITSPGTYEITVEDLENGCISSDIVQIVANNTLPEIETPTPNLLTCAVLLSELNASQSEIGPDINYLWTTTNGNIVSGANSLIATVNEPGIYTFLVTNSYTGCFDEIEVTVEQDIELPSIDAGDAFILPCNEDNLSLDGSVIGSGFSYEWSTPDGQIISGGNSLTPLVASEGIYNLLVTNLINGCASEDWTEVTEIRPEEAVWDAYSPLCIDDYGLIVATEVIGGTPPYVYSIDGGESFQTNILFAPLDAGSYDLVIQDALGCELEASEIIVPAQEVLVDVEPFVELQFGDSYQLNALTNLIPDQIGTIQWTPSISLSCSDCLDPIATPSETTDYLVEITDINGCIAEARITLVVDKRPAIYIPNVFSPDGDGTNDIFYIFAKEGTIATIESFQIYSRWGEPVYQHFNFQPNDPNFGWDGNFRGVLMNPAVFAYYAVIKMTDGRIELFKGDVTLVR